MVGEQRFRSEIYAWFPDGRVVRVSPEDDGAYYQACISPDATNVVFGGAHTGPPRLWRAELDGSGARALTPANKAAFLASYSWDGSSIVFSSDLAFDVPSVPVEAIPDPRVYRTGTMGPNYRDFNLFVMDAEGRDVRQITHGEQRDLRGTFTPDGTTLTFFSNRQPYAPFWHVPADGSGEPVALPMERSVSRGGYRPWYTPDASTIYYFGVAQDTPGRFRLFKLDAAGGVPEALPFDDRGKTQAPFVDPRTGALLFHSTRSGRAQLYELVEGATEPRLLDPAGLELPPGAEIMHPTRARDGTICFDLSSHAGSSLLIRLRSLRKRIAARFSGARRSRNH